MYTRTLSLGRVDARQYGYKGHCRVEIDVELHERPQGFGLSMCASVWKPNGSDIIMGGQCADEIAKLFPNDARVQRMVEVWKRWHLNHMRAGCEHQRAEGWHLSEHGWTTPDEDPEGLLTKPCPTCEYEFGTEWLFEPLPDEVVAQVKSW